MKLLALSIDGFRGVQRAKIRFGYHDVPVGPNGSGKSTIIDALSLVFGRTRLVRDLTERDFHGSCPEAKSRLTTLRDSSLLKPISAELLVTEAYRFLGCCK